MRVLILGGTGLISSAIVRKLIGRGFETTIFSRGRATAFEPPRGVGTIRGNRLDSDRFRRRFREEQPFDVVIDMICFSATQARDLVAAFAGRTTQVIFCSTVEVYSQRTQAGQVSESHSRMPTNPYGREKAKAEDVLREAERAGSFAVTILRPAYTYGEGGTLISALEGAYPARIQAGRPIIVPGDGMHTWVTCHRDDVAQAFVTAAGNSGAVGRTYNVAGTETMTWNDYHHSIARALGVGPPRLVHVPLEVLTRALPESFGPRAFIFDSHYSFDVSSAADDLNFRPAGWEAGLRRMLGWIEQEGQLEMPPDDTLEDWLANTWMEAVETVVAGAVERHAWNA
jgi:nucleoside-diphosphate-sugar epimerase